MKRVNTVALIATLSATMLYGCGGDNPPPPAPEVFTPPTRVPSLAAQTATITITDPAGTPTVSVTNAADIDLTATVTSPGAGGAGTIDVLLSATNNSGRIISNLKAVTDTAGSTLGTATIASTGTIGAEDYSYFGTKAVADGASATAIDPFAITLGATPAAPMTIDVTFPTEHVTVLISEDSGNNGSGLPIADVVSAENDYIDLWVDFPYNYGSGAAQAREGDSSFDGTKIFMGQRQMPNVLVYDTVEGTVSAIDVAEETGDVGAVDSVAVSPDGRYAYASVLIGDHMYEYYSSSTNKVQLVKIDVETSEILARLDLTASSAANRLHRLSISADGTQGVAAIRNGGKVAHVDLENMELIQMLDVSATGNYPRNAAISPDSAYAYVAHQQAKNGDSAVLEVIDLADGSSSEVTLTTSNDWPRGLHFSDDGELFYIRNTAAIGVTRLTFTGGDYSMPTGETEVNTTGNPDGFDFGPYGKYYYVCTNGTIRKFDITNDTQVVSATIGGDGHLCSVSAY